MTAHDTHDEQSDIYPGQPDGMTNMSVDQEPATVTNLRPTVGDELRMRREQSGHTINEVSEAVRIQPRYLEALENGRLEDLPGTVYALGFLRTYAEHYGFNGDEFVTRFKEETEGLRQQQDYILPEPIEDARVPTAAIIIVAIVLAIGAYVAWYSLRPKEAEIAGAVPEVPTQLSATQEPASPPLVESAPAQVDEGDTPPPASPETTTAVPEAPAVAAASSEQPMTVETPAPVEAPAPLASPPTAVESLELPASPAEPATEPDESAVAETPAETPTVEAPAETRVSDAQPVETTPVETPPVEAAPTEATSTEPAAAETPATASIEVETRVSEMQSTTEIATVTAPEPPTTDTVPVEEAPYVPQTFGAGNVDARIVITAADDSWVEITDEEGNRLLSRTMRAGDSYRVPDRAGLVLVTGNAGGLSIAVDGAATPSIGDTGIVRKNVKLDPELLKQGRAWP